MTYGGLRALIVETIASLNEIGIGRNDRVALPNGPEMAKAYGMTEAAHQMTSNPLHGVRKPGSVGLAAGPEVAIMDENGHLLEAGEVGEIVIRGENVTTGYENNPKANAEAFVNGWLRTGDQGFKDADDT